MTGAHERSVSINGADLYVREIGGGHPIVVLHGGPDFDHTYLLPELDQLADSCRLVYYDQRGRGRSAAGVHPSDVSIESEMADLDELREHLRLNRIALLGHSWGAVLAMEYATRYPASVSHLVLMNTAPASGWESERLRELLRDGRPGGDAQRMEVIASGAAYRAGDLRAEADYYRIHFRGAVPRADQLDLIIPRLRMHFTEDGVLTARAIEQRLYEQTWQVPGYDLVPSLQRIAVPTLVVHGERDLVPVAMAERIADGIPGARLEVLAGSGHFAYLEQPELVRELVHGLINN